jgi:hypothetical protein
MRWCVFIPFVGLILLSAPAALADCRSDVAALQPRVDSAPAGRTKELLAFDLKRARQELGEGDEDECHEAVEHAQNLLRGKD